MKIAIPILILLIITVPAMAQDDAPYLYYFDPNKSAFVIERSDGTDHHLLAQNVMPEEVRSVAGPGWSPSGQRLAWQGIIGRVQINEATFLPYALNIETGQFITQLDSFEETFVLEWHPSRDWLLAIGLADSTENGFGYQIFRIALIDASTDTTIAAYSFESYPQSVVTTHQWQSDGVIIAHADIDTVEFWRLNHKGVTHFEHTTSAHAISPAGYLIYDFGGGDWLIDNLATREVSLLQVEFMSLDGAQWQGNRALIADGGLWLLDVEDATSTLIEDEIMLTIGLWSGVGYRRLGNVDGLWSPDGQHVAYLTVDQELMVSDGDSSETLIDNVVDWGWVDSETILVALYDEAAPVFMEMSIDGDHQSAKVDHGFHPVWFSPDQTHVSGFTGAGPWIETFAEDELIELPRHSAVDSTADYGGEILWHKSSGWLIIKETPFVSMMGDDPALNTVIRADGEMRRELPNCFVLCVEWLPEQVNIQNLPESD